MALVLVSRIVMRSILRSPPTNGGARRCGRGALLRRPGTVGTAIPVPPDRGAGVAPPPVPERSPPEMEDALSPAPRLALGAARCLRGDGDLGPQHQRHQRGQCEAQPQPFLMRRIAYLPGRPRPTGRFPVAEQRLTGGALALDRQQIPAAGQTTAPQQGSFVRIPHSAPRLAARHPASLKTCPAPVQRSPRWATCAAIRAIRPW
jgi:hypothetical protein